jgi:RNA polymerase sigma-70 factor, ECF subfamily
MSMTAKKANLVPSQAWKASTTAAEAPGQFEALFLEHWPHVFGFLLRLVGDHAEAEDLALETFMRLYQSPPDAGRELKLGGWLHRVAANLGLNAIRGWKRREHYELEAGRVEAFDHGEPSPIEALIAREEQHRVRLILSEMHPRQAQLLVMRHSGMAYREVAAVLGLSATSIGPLLARAEEDFEKRYRASSGSGEEVHNAPG